MRCLLLCIAWMPVMGCLSGSGNSDRESQILFQQYMVHGRILYQAKCSNCHMENGAGLKKLIPPLAQSDYLKDLQKTICGIKHGIRGEIRVNQVLYNQPMPANEEFTDLEIAEVVTYIANSWDNQKGLIRINQVTRALKECP